MIIRNCLSPVHAYFPSTPFGKVSAKDPSAASSDADEVKNNEEKENERPKSPLRLPYPRGCLREMKWNRERRMEELQKARDQEKEKSLVERLCEAWEEVMKPGKS
ncbi:hypothetical protein PUNSTDRAFT_52138 [Punctularia strigosozonata HHB-11173 SS5]|uniref:uncharacterized protein n=1 Tax=Punctularia strigosozonata (strain HHB-11173) TaxID=741275 RepID=UPI0004417A6A|nr:uncharacterized protein PUNSTDRAFT_52138 [Punctularia strigosozonata HHB-11173 SS5]EIN10045.1 hypothetical protein PUNSTDRAFT_52138 [Punctularia strigosozonata HHB-11173 SS5]